LQLHYWPGQSSPAAAEVLWFSHWATVDRLPAGYRVLLAHCLYSTLTPTTCPTTDKHLAVSWGSNEMSHMWQLYGCVTCVLSGTLKLYSLTHSLTHCWWHQEKHLTKLLKPGFHYTSWRPELTARVDGWPVSITRQHGPWWRAHISTSRVDGPSTWLVETRAHQHDPCWRVMETGHPSTRAVNLGSGNRAWLF